MKAIISGAGIAGLAAAYELGRAGWDVVVLEKADSLRDGGYMIDFFGPGYDAAEANGLLDAFARHARKVEGVELVNADGSRQGYMSYRSFAILSGCCSTRLGLMLICALAPGSKPWTMAPRRSTL